MTGLDWLLIGSLGLNAVLGIGLFFQSALNEMLSHWFKGRVMARGDRQRELLIELNGRMQAFDRDYFLSSVYLATPITKPNELVKTSGDAVMATNHFIELHELEFPRAVRDRLADLKGAMAFKDIGFDGPTLIEYAELLRASDAVSAATMAVRREIEKVIG